MLDFNRKIILYLHRSSWPRGQAVKTPPFHGGIMGSNPVGVTKKTPCLVFFFIAPTAFAPQTVPSAPIRAQVGCVTLTLASKFALLAITGSYTLHIFFEIEVTSFKITGSPKKHLVWCFFIASTAFAPQAVPSALIRPQVGCVTLAIASKFAPLPSQVLTHFTILI